MLKYSDLDLSRKVTVGLDFPSYILDDLRAVDNNLYLIWHPYNVQWDDIINEYEGRLEEGRTTIHKQYGETNFGFVYTDGQGAPIQSNSWHIWRFNPDHGWAHVIKLETTHPEYVDKVLRILHTYRCFTQKYGFKSYNRLQAELKDQEREQMLKDHKEYLNAWQDENKWLRRKAMENLSRGIVTPTNPQKEIIASYAGQTNRTKIVRPLEDEEGGIISP